MNQNTLKALQMLKTFKKNYAKQGDLTRYGKITQWIQQIKAHDRIAIEDAEIALHVYLKTVGGK